MSSQPGWHKRQDDERSEHSHGTAAEEAAKLFVAVRDRLMADPTAARLGSTLVEWFSALGAAGGDLTHDAASECCRCPVCIAVARARSTSPETVEAVTSAAIQFAEALRQAFVTTTEDLGVRHVPLDDDDEAG